MADKNNSSFTPEDEARMRARAAARAQERAHQQKIKDAKDKELKKILNTLNFIMLQIIPLL